MIHPADLPLNRTLIMGILNITPDSFSGDGLVVGGDATRRALEKALQFIEDGADILDIGGESTRPGSQVVSAQEEIERVVPVIHAIRQQTDITISVDTYKADVAAAALGAGADWINDVWALRADPQMAPLAARTGAPLVLMHNRSKPGEVILQQRLGGMYQGAEYHDLMGEVCEELLDSVCIAENAGVARHSIIMDPGIGFGKTVTQNLELIARLNEVKGLGFPVLLGPSRKSFIGYTLDLPPEERLEGTLAALAVGITRGANIVRVHDVRQTFRLTKMVDAILGSV